MADDDAVEQFIEKYNNMAKMFYRYAHTASNLNHKIAERKEK
jgi:F420-non-reducing hydrogenase small subunit